MPPEAGKASPKGAGAPAAAKVGMSDLQADAPDTYTVVKGDTLWGIAGRFLKDPWKWPEIWNMNKDQIKNPHRIYPGDVIRLDKSGAYPSLSISQAGMGADAAAANVVKVDPRIRVETLRTSIPSIPGSAIGPFLTQPMVVEAGGLDETPAIVATEESRVVIGAGDIAYADRIGGGGPVNWQIYRPGRPLTDPETNEVLGYEARYVGDARVKRFGNPSTMEIIKVREEINRGDRLMPSREATLPSYVPHAPDKPIKGSIMSVDGGVSEFGQFAIISINRGSRDGIEVGHVLASYRRGEVVGEVRRGKDIIPSWGPGLDLKPVQVVPEPPRRTIMPDPETGPAPVTAPPAGPSIQLPDERNGLIFVFRVFEKMSYAMVMKASRPIYVGDIVQTP